MRLPRFSISSILAVIAIFAIALAALRSPSYLWANVVFSLSLAALFVAIVNIVYGRGAGRAYWFGFLLSGGIYFAVCSMPGLRDSVCSRLVTEVILDFLYPYLSPDSTTSSGVTTVISRNTGATPALTLRTSTLTHTAVLSLIAQSPSPWAAWTEPDRTVGVGYKIGTVSLVSSEAFRQIGHSMFTLLVAVLGGSFARHRYRTSVMDRTVSESAS
jgi:hypothetical protein